MSIYSTRINTKKKMLLFRHFPSSSEQSTTSMLRFLILIASIRPSKTRPDYSLFTYKHTPNFAIDHDRKRLHWYDLLFVSFLICLFFLLLFCLYCKQFIINTFCVRSSTKKFNQQTMTIVHSTSPLIDQTKSMYLTVPQPSYVRH